MAVCQLKHNPMEPKHPMRARRAEPTNPSMESEPELQPVVVQTMDPDSGAVIDLVECRPEASGVSCLPLPAADNPHRFRAEQLAEAIRRTQYAEGQVTTAQLSEFLEGVRAEYDRYPYLFVRPNGGQ